MPAAPVTGSIKLPPESRQSHVPFHQLALIIVVGTSVDLAEGVRSQAQPPGRDAIHSRRSFTPSSWTTARPICGMDILGAVDSNRYISTDSFGAPGTTSYRSRP